MGREKMNFVVTGSVEQIRDVLCGPQDHNEHCKGWRWHLYCQDDEKRFQNVMAEVRKMRDERRARLAAIEDERKALEAAE
jgi:hypothetical protein